MNDDAIKVMALNVLDTHDRLSELKKTIPDILSKGCDDCLKKNPDSLFYQERSPYIYIFAHPRTEPDGNRKKMLWQPRLIRPDPQPNSYCFRVISKTDVIEICWLLPPMEIWGQHRRGNIVESPEVQKSISLYLHDRKELKRAHPQDMSEDRAKHLLLELARWKEGNAKLMLLEDSSSPSEKS